MRFGTLHKYPSTVCLLRLYDEDVIVVDIHRAIVLELRWPHINGGLYPFPIWIPTEIQNVMKCTSFD